MITGRSGNKEVNGISAGCLSKSLSGFQRVLHFGDQRERGGKIIGGKILCNVGEKAGTILS